jgi:DNA-directed RNA polymerase specialized sigma24 family protein
VSTNVFREALLDWDIRQLREWLVRYASARLRRCGWPADGREVGAEDLVHDAVVAGLDGTRAWTPGKVDVLGFLRGVVRSLASSVRKSYIRRGPHEDGTAAHGLAAPDGVKPDAIADAREQLSLFGEALAATATTPDLRDYVMAAVESGVTKREQIAIILGWAPERVSATRIKLQRRLRSYRDWDVSGWHPNERIEPERARSA